MVVELLRATLLSYFSFSSLLYSTSVVVNMVEVGGQDVMEVSVVVEEGAVEVDVVVEEQHLEAQVEEVQVVEELGEVPVED